MSLRIRWAAARGHGVTRFVQLDGTLHAALALPRGIAQPYEPRDGHREQLSGVAVPTELAGDGAEPFIGSAHAGSVGYAFENYPAGVEVVDRSPKVSFFLGMPGSFEVAVAEQVVVAQVLRHREGTVDEGLALDAATSIFTSGEFDRKPQCEEHPAMNTTFWSSNPETGLLLEY